MNDAVVEALKIVGYRAAGIEGDITNGIPDPTIYIQRAMELLDDYEKVGRLYEINLVKLTSEMNGFISLMIEKYHPDLNYEESILNASKAVFSVYEESILNASKAVFSVYSELLKLKKPIRLT